MIYKILILLLVFIVLNIIIFFYNKLVIIKNLNVKMDEAKKDIDILQEKELNILTKISKKMNSRLNEKILINLPKIKNKNLNIFELQKELHELNNEINNIILEGSIELIDEEKSLVRHLKNTSLKLEAVEQYYNSNANMYNSYIKKIKYLFIRIIKRLKKVDIFYFEKSIDFEILKEH